MEQTGKNRPGRRFSLTFLRGEIESGYSSIQDLLYMENVCKVCIISKRIRKIINKIL